VSARPEGSRIDAAGNDPFSRRKTESRNYWATRRKDAGAVLGMHTCAATASSAYLAHNRRQPFAAAVAALNSRPLARCQDCAGICFGNSVSHVRLLHCHRRITCSSAIGEPTPCAGSVPSFRSLRASPELLGRHAVRAGEQAAEDAAAAADDAAAAAAAAAPDAEADQEPETPAARAHQVSHVLEQFHFV